LTRKARAFVTSALVVAVAIPSTAALADDAGYQPHHHQHVPGVSAPKTPPVTKENPFQKAKTKSYTVTLRYKDPADQIEAQATRFRDAAENTKRYTEALKRAAADKKAAEQRHKSAPKPIVKPKPVPPPKPKPKPKPKPTYANNLNGWINEAMAKSGVSPKAKAKWHHGLKTMAIRESHGNPHAINKWDSNAAKGTPSKGLVQCIEPTFRHYHQAGTSHNIYDPVASLSAAINYIKANYGDISHVQQANPHKSSQGY
jgi:transglycosylase-like protein with SLT domain